MVWTGIDFLTFTQYLDDLDPTFDVGQQRTPSGLRGGQTYGDEIVERIRDFAHKFTNNIQPRYFVPSWCFTVRRSKVR